jgi:hypothetical protein
MLYSIHACRDTHRLTLNQRIKEPVKCIFNWSRVPVNKIFIEQNSLIDPNKVKVMIPMYEPLEGWREVDLKHITEYQLFLIDFRPATDKQIVPNARIIPTPARET